MPEGDCLVRASTTPDRAGHGRRFFPIATESCKELLGEFAGFLEVGTAWSRRIELTKIGYDLQPGRDQRRLARRRQEQASIGVSVPSATPQRPW